MSITDRGFVFSVDLAITAIVIFMILFLITAAFSTKSRQETAAMKRFRLEKNAVFMADALVKNNSENAMLGAALFNAERHRVMSNELDWGRLAGTEAIETGEFFVQRLFIRHMDGEEEIIIRGGRNGKDCIAVDRIASMANETVLVGVVLCET